MKLTVYSIVKGFYMIYDKLKFWSTFLFLLFYSVIVAFAQQDENEPVVNLTMGEIVIFKEYQYKNDREKRTYDKLEEDLRVIYPLLKIVRSEYVRINKELEFYSGDKEKKFLKWYENYARESFMHHLSVLNVRQGRLFLKLVTRELDRTPYDLIKEYRNGFRAIVWQGAAHLFLSDLRADYDPEKNPMIEHIMMRLDAENEPIPANSP